MGEKMDAEIGCGWKGEDLKEPTKIIEVKRDPERGGWNNKLDFLFSCISVSVGLGNVWRFPYLCYKNGGGAFLVTYFIAMIFCGIPIFFQEVAIGQYLGSGGMTLVGSICPLLQGAGYATMTIVFLLDVYYCIIIAWTLFYLLSTFVVLPDLPWQYCGNWWNTPNCRDEKMHSNETFFAQKNESYFGRTSNETTTPVEEFWVMGYPVKVYVGTSNTGNCLINRENTVMPLYQERRKDLSGINQCVGV